MQDHTDVIKDEEAQQARQQVAHKPAQRPRIRPAIQEGASEKAATFKHRPVINVWGFKSPLLTGSTFKASLRVKVFDGMKLEGSCLRVIDATTHEVLASTRVGTADDTAAGLLQDDVEIRTPAEPGLYKYYVVLDDGSDSVPAQITFPFSCVPQGDRTVTVLTRDDASGVYNSGKPLANSTVFFYNKNLPKTKPIEAVTDENGVARAQIVSGVPYRVEAVHEDYVMAFLEIPAEPTEDDAYEIPMKFVFNVKIKRPF